MELAKKINVTFSSYQCYLGQKTLFKTGFGLFAEIPRFVISQGWQICVYKTSKILCTFILHPVFRRYIALDYYKVSSNFLYFLQQIFFFFHSCFWSYYSLVYNVLLKYHSTPPFILLCKCLKNNQKNVANY